MTDAATSDAWVPLGETPATEPRTLVPGVPQWLRPEIGQFLGRMASARSDWLVEYRHVRQNDENYQQVFELIEWEDIVATFGEEESLNLVDFALRFLPSSNIHVRDLAHWLHTGGSMWKVGIRNGQPGLERRVPPEVGDLAERAMKTDGDIGVLLSKAWALAFGRNPDPEASYVQTVKAVEAATVPLILSGYAGATLGKVIQRLDNQKHVEWSLGFRREHTVHPSGETLASMMRTIWTGHDDRHAGQADYAPSRQEDAETAVLLAATLIYFFRSGKVIHTPPAPPAV